MCSEVLRVILMRKVLCVILMRSAEVGTHIISTRPLCVIQIGTVLSGIILVWVVYKGVCWWVVGRGDAGGAGGAGGGGEGDGVAGAKLSDAANGICYGMLSRMVCVVVYCNASVVGSVCGDCVLLY